MAEFENPANSKPAELGLQKKAAGQWAVPEKPRWHRLLWNVYMISVSLILFLSGITFLFGLGGGFPNKTAGIMLLCTSLLAFPAIFDRLRGRISPLRSKFGHAILLFCAIATIQITFKLLLMVEKNTDPAAAELRKIKLTAVQQARDSAAQKAAASDAITDSKIAEVATQKSKQETQSAFDQLWAGVLRHTTQCENAQSRLAETFARGNFSVEAYDYAHQGRQTLNRD